METNEVDNLLKLKLIVVGNQNTGKSCILNRFVNETFDESYQATIGMDFFSKNVSIHGQDVRLILYDTAGQEKYRSLIPMYIRDTQIILLIYDITDRESFNSIPVWLKEVLNVKNTDVIFALIGNKMDLTAKREVSFEEGQKLASNNKFIFQEVSAKSGENFSKLFEEQIYEEIYNRYQHEFGENDNMDEYEDNNENDNNHKNSDNKNKVRLGSDNMNNDDNMKKKKKCC
jgi:Ras-related protein Rab-6A